MRQIFRPGFAILVALIATAAWGADVVPNEARLPGTQPGEVSQIQSVSKCDNCHGNFEPDGEPWFNWAGSMMAHASRDPIFWATVAVAEQDFDGAGDFCVRCHVPEGWLGGRSTPTDGSGLAEGDDDGLQCDVCHRLTNPDGSEHVGVQNPPFVANSGGGSPEGFYGSGMYVIWDEQSKLGPYADADANHQFQQSAFHRSSALCGTCHDVSNPVVGDLAPNHGAQTPLTSGFSGVLGAPVDEKAAFNHPPYAYGVVERTYSEHVASSLSQTPVSAFDALPDELKVQGGSIREAREAALLAGQGGDYADQTTRLFSCQTCHMRPTVGQGCNKNPPVRNDLPVHDLTGGNYWSPAVIQYQDSLGQLALGGGLTSDQVDALNVGALRAQRNLREAASLSIEGNAVRVVNLTGHKLISGYPEGRRMWLRVEWFDAPGATEPFQVDGAYGEIVASIDGVDTPVRTLLDPDDPYAKVYEAHAAITQDWAAGLLALHPPDLPLSFDRETGQVTRTLGQVASEPAGTHHETFHFALNNFLAKDNRIPPYQMSWDESVKRNILPVPPDQYGGADEPGEFFEHFDVVPLNVPEGAVSARVELLYQPTSWEYIQFLYLANTGQSAFLADQGSNLLDAWFATGMAEPYVMTSATWNADTPACSDGIDNDGDGLVDYDSDPGCSATGDSSENDPNLACDDRLDGDGDGWIDYPQDPGCFAPASTLEDPACQDGLDNDGDGKIDFDGGLAAGLDPPGVPDPNCSVAALNREKPKGCGLGAEVGLLLLPLFWLAARRRKA